MSKTNGFQLRAANGAGATTALAFHPDGKRAVSAAEDRRLRVWDAGSGALLATLSRSTEGVEGSYDPELFFAAGGALLLAADASEALVFDLATGANLKTLAGRARLVHPDGKRVLMARAGAIEWVQLDSGLGGHPVAPFRRGGGYGYHPAQDSMSDAELAAAMPDAGLVACALLADGRRLVASSDSYETALVDLDQREVLQSWNGAVEALDAPGGRALLRESAGSADLLVADLQAGGLGATLASAGKPWLHPDGKRALTAQPDGALKLWELASGDCLWEFSAHAGAADQIAFEPRGDLAVSSSPESPRPMIWDLSTGKGEDLPPEAEGDEITRLDIHPNGWLAARTAPRFEAWDPRSKARLAHWSCAAGWIAGYALGRSGAGIWTSEGELVFVGDP